MFYINKTGVFTVVFLHLAEMLNTWHNCVLFNVINGNLSDRVVVLHKRDVTLETVAEMDKLETFVLPIAIVSQDVILKSGIELNVR